jgi:predicted ATP-dependent serine protease
VPVCDICGETEDRLYKCKQCGARFCEWCGSIDDSLCSNCFDEEDDDEYEEDDEEYGEDLFYDRSR